MTHTRQLADSGTITSTASTLNYNPATDGIADSWWATYGITGSSRVAANDADGDGFTNAQEFAFGLNPSSAGGKTVEVSPTDSNKIVFLQRTSGATYQVQSATDLGSGFNGTVTANAAADQAGVPDGYTRYEATFPSGGRGFLRVQATLNP